MFLKLLFITTFISISYGSDLYYLVGEKKISLEPLRDIERDVNNVDFYMSRGIVVGISDSLIVKVEDKRALDLILKQFNLKLYKKLYKNSYLLKVKNKKDTISISNDLNRVKGVIYSHPNFIKKRFKR